MRDAATRGCGGGERQTPTRPRVTFEHESHGETPGATLTRPRRERLARLLVGKSLLETLFVVVLATSFHYAAFNPRLRGSVDRADAHAVEGWAVDEGSPDARVEVQLYLDGRHAGVQPADRPRPDVLAAGRAADERHGFAFKTPALPPGEHEARVYALHAPAEGRRHTLQQLGGPVRFVSAAEGGRGPIIIAP